MCALQIQMVKYIFNSLQIIFSIHQLHAHEADSLSHELFAEVEVVSLLDVVSDEEVDGVEEGEEGAADRHHRMHPQDKQETARSGVPHVLVEFLGTARFQRYRQFQSHAVVVDLK